MIRLVPASDYIFDTQTPTAQNRNRLPEDISRMLFHFSDYGNPDSFFEVLGWEEYYASIISCYNALRYHIKNHKLHIEVVVRGDRIYMHHF